MMAAQFLLNLFIALLWVLLKDEDVLRWQTIVVGFIVGSVIIYMMRRFFGGRFYLHRFLSIIKLMLIFISETIQSTIVVIKHIITPKINIEPGIFSYKTILHSEWDVTTLSLLLKLTSGTVFMLLMEDGSFFSINSLYI